jgi:hypothetical protein
VAAGGSKRDGEHVVRTPACRFLLRDRARRIGLELCSPVTKNSSAQRFPVEWSPWALGGRGKVSVKQYVSEQVAPFFLWTINYPSDSMTRVHINFFEVIKTS